MTTNTPAPAHEAALTQAEIEALCDKHDMPPMMVASFARAIESALLSKLRAPVASAEVMDALNWVDDFVARCNRDDRGSCESVNVLRRALASAPVAKTVTKQDALNRFDFLEGAVDQQTYEQIADAALDLCASAPVAVPAECTNKLVSAHYRRGWNACRAEILRSESAPVAGEAMTDLIEDLSDLASDMAYEANQEMDQEKATRAALIERGERALRRIADAAPQASKPHEVAALVSRLWNIAEKYHGTQQLRDRISHEILPLLDLQASEAVRDAALDELGRRVVNRAVAGCLMVRDIQAIVADLKAQSTALSAQPGAQKDS